MKNRIFLEKWLCRHLLAALVCASVFVSINSGAQDVKRPKRVAGDPCSVNIKAHYDSIDSIAFSPNGAVFVSGAHRVEGKAKVWDIPSGRLLKVIGSRDSSVEDLSFSKDGNRLSVGWFNFGDIDIWDMVSMKRIIQINGNHGPLYAQSLHPEGSLVASGWRDGTIDIWEIPSGDLLLRIFAHEETVRIVEFSPDGNYLVSCAKEKRFGDVDVVKVYRIPSGELAKEFRTEVIGAITFRRDSQVIAMGYHSDVPVKLFQFPSLRLLSTLEYENKKLDVDSLSFHPDGSSILTGGKIYSEKPSFYGIIVWDIASRKGHKLVACSESSAQVLGAFSADGQHVAAGFWSGKIKILNASSGECLGMLSDQRGGMRPSDTIWIPVFR